jgi:hypothetical protein
MSFLYLLLSFKRLTYFNQIVSTDLKSEGARYDKQVRRRRARSVCCPIVDGSTRNLDRTDDGSAGTRAGDRNGGQLGAGVRRFFAEDGRKLVQLCIQLCYQVFLKY